MTPLRVAFETQFATGTPTGLGVYSQRLAAALASRPDIELIELRDRRFDVWRFDRRLYWDQVRAPMLAASLRADVVHFTGGTLPLVAPHPSVLTVHDLAWLDGMVTGRFYSRLYFGRLTRRLARKADGIATDTETMRSHIIERLSVPEAHVAVCGVGLDGSWFTVAPARRDPPYLLCVGTVERRKDLVTAVQALPALPGVRLVSVGPLTAYARQVHHAAVAARVDGRVELRGFVDDATLRSLYAGALAFVFPSRYEGFGLPPLQALAAGIPVVASDLPVLREVLGSSALFARTGDPASFAERLRAAMDLDRSVCELVERGRAHARTFTWAAVAQRAVELYRRVNV